MTANQCAAKLEKILYKPICRTIINGLTSFEELKLNRCLSFMKGDNVNAHLVAFVLRESKDEFKSSARVVFSGDCSPVDDDGIFYDG